MTVDMTKKPKRTALYVILGIAAAIVLAMCGATLGGALSIDHPITPTKSPAAVKASATPAGNIGSQSPIAVKVTSAAPAPKVWGEGIWQVGKEIPAGSYVTTGNGNCYWARLKDDSGSFSSIIANDNIGDGARGRVGIKATDKFVEFSGGCEWRKA